jgi:cytochrome c553
MCLWIDRGSARRVATTVVGVLWLAGCTAGQGRGNVRQQMFAHFDRASELRAAALRGDLSAVRRAADLLADLERPSDLGPDLAPQFLPFTRVARDAGRASSPDEAARATARVASACADCHVANRVGLGERLGVPPAPRLGDHAQEAAHAAGLLWNGVAGPSDVLWRTGAAALEEAGPPPAVPPGRLPAGYGDDAQAHLRQLAGDASAAALPGERDRLLGEIWATCAGCHSLAGLR